ncbi:hypothetical protein SBOR_0026 [Sclerotinia borealis F-4128]|uniref:Uncharacterized protein n=1 Tax=Sclerotinia borealis (strain F-4128) TaxID=1432307 RepID=W9CUJ4_SCLBF|nr:hypothetical protein SBOR_0026 [Sclerotinia borealis F-4128]
MCVKKFWGYTCGHCSPCFLVKCPTTAQNDNFPPCSIPAEQPIFANQFCHACMRVNWNKGVIAEEEAHKGRHERGECGCEVVFDRGERERREREREAREKEVKEVKEREEREEREREVRALREGGGELEAREQRREREMEGSGSGSGSGSASGRDGNGRFRARGRGKGRGAADAANGAGVASATEKTGEKNGGEEREGKKKQMEEYGGDAGMMRGMNSGFTMGASSSSSGYHSPRATDPNSTHRYQHYAHNNMGGGPMDNTGLGNMFDVNPMTGIIAGLPISNPPPITSSSEMYGDMMIIPPSPRMSAMGVYPMGHPILTNRGTDNHPYDVAALGALPPAGPSNWQSPGIMTSSTYSDGNSSSVYAGNQSSWNPNPHLNAPSMDHRASYRDGQTRSQHPTLPAFADPNVYQQYRQLDPDAQRNAYNYVGYYCIDRPTGGSPQTRAQGPVPTTDPQTNSGFIRAPTISALPGGTAGAGMVWHSSYNSQPPLPPLSALPNLPPQIPYFGDSAPAAPRYSNEALSVSRRHARNNARNPFQRSRTSPSVGTIHMQGANNTGPAQMDSHATPGTTLGQVSIHSNATTPVTTPGQSQVGSEDTPVTMNISVLRTPRVISSMPRPNSTM